MESAGSGVDMANVKMPTNPFDEILVGLGGALKKARVATDVIEGACGVSQCHGTLRTAMAIGADQWRRKVAVLQGINRSGGGRIHFTVRLGLE